MAIISCPNCGKRTSDRLSICPHCNSTLSKEYKKEHINKETKPQFSLTMLAFGLSAVGIIVWYFITSRFIGQMGVYAIAAFATVFYSKIYIALVLGVIIAIALAFTSKIKVVQQKTICILLGVVGTIISYFILLAVGIGREGSPEVVKLALSCDSAINLYFASNVSLTCSSVFIASIGRKKNKAIRNALIIASISLVLSIALAYLSVCIFVFGVNGLILCAIAPVVALVLSVFLK